ncbi:ABC transporter permease [Methanofollis fontis]|nr:iron export ABC transporter permease subunit FetB [Methanofollis fontis]
MADPVYDPVAGLFNLAMALVLVVIVLVISRRFELRLEREITVASVRAIVQLLIVVLVIAAVFTTDNLLLVLIVLIGMAVVAAHTSATRVKSGTGGMAVTLPAIGVGSGTGMGILILLGVVPLEPEFIIPVGSMTIGGSMIECSLSLDRFAGEMRAHAAEVETALCLGATPGEAAAPYARESVRASLIPSIDRLRTLGIVVLPGTMAGMIIAGIDPFWAAEYQLVIMFLLLSAGLLTSIIAVHAAERAASRENTI